MFKNVNKENPEQKEVIKFLNSKLVDSFFYQPMHYFDDENPGQGSEKVLF
jgi:hypothetical protein